MNTQRDSICRLGRPLTFSRFSKYLIAALAMLCGWAAPADWTPQCLGQDYERYKPLDLNELNGSNRLEPKPKIPRPDVVERKTDDRILVHQLDAIVLVDSAEKISTEKLIDEFEGVLIEIDDPDSILHCDRARQIAESHIGKPVTLRELNSLAKELNEYFRDRKLPFVDVKIPEQRITGGTVYLVVVESRIDNVHIETGQYFDLAEVSRWIRCTRPSNRIYEPHLESDLFWLNQNPFRKASVDFKKGGQAGTTDVIFKIEDYRPFRFYSGIDDSGVSTLNYGRFFAGFQHGNFLGKGGNLGYQYTADEDFQRLEAHSLSWAQPISRDFTFSTYGSWAGVSPALGFGLLQNGESWQIGSTLTRHFIRTRQHQKNASIGYEYKSTNNNLEFAGSNIAASNADLFQIRIGFDDLVRTDADQYRLFRLTTFIGPGGGLTSGHSSSAFNSIRPGTSPDYIYANLNWERHQVFGRSILLARRFSAQASSERLLFSETFGLGGFNTIRGTDQRSYNADHGWNASVELGPVTKRWGCEHCQKSLRLYSFLDMGNGYIASPQAGEDSYTFAASTGIGARFQFSDRVTARFDYGTTFEDFDNVPRNSRAHFGLTWLSPKRR